MKEINVINKHASNKGSILVATIFVIMLMSSLGISIIFMNMTGVVSEVRDEEALSALYLAEAGINYVKSHPMASNGTTALGSGSFTLEINRLGSSALLDVISTGKVGEATRIITRRINSGSSLFPDDVVLLFEGETSTGELGETEIIDSSIYQHEGIGTNVETSDAAPEEDYWGNPITKLEFIDKHESPTNSNSFVKIDDHEALDLTTAGTLSTWVYAHPDSGFQGLEGLISKGSGKSASYSLQYIDNGNIDGESVHQVISLAINGGGMGHAVHSGRVKLLPGRWYHVLGTWSANDTAGENGVADGPDGMRVYVNGTLITEKSYAVEAIPTTDPLYVGTLSESGQETFFTGFLTNVLVMDRALEAQEVESLFRSRQLSYQFSENLSIDSEVIDSTIHKYSGITSSGVSSDTEDGTFTFDGTGGVSTKRPWVNLNIVNDSLSITTRVKIDNVGESGTEEGIIFYNRYLGVDTKYQDDIITKLEVLGGRFVFTVGAATASLGNGVNSATSMVVTSQNDIEPNQWYDIAALYKGNNSSLEAGDWAELYVGGKKQGNRVVGDIPPYVGNEIFPQYHILRIGQDLAGTNHFKGKIDYVSIFNRVLLNTDIGYYSRQPIALWKLDEISALPDYTVHDSIAGRYNGSVHAVPSADGAPLELNGIDQYVSGNIETGVGSSLTDGYPMTMNIWMKTDGVIGSQDWSIFNLNVENGAPDDENYRITLYMSKNTGSLILEVGESIKNVLTTTVRYDDGAEYMLTAVFIDAFRMKLYINGSIAVDSDNYDEYKNKNVSADNMFDRWTLGAWRGSNLFKGNLWQASLYNIALEADEVLELYNEGY